MNKRTTAPPAHAPPYLSQPGGPEPSADRASELLRRIEAGQPLGLNDYARAEELLAAPRILRLQSGEAGKLLRLRVPLVPKPSGTTSAEENRSVPEIPLRR
jgi:hypothetical protein